VTVEIAFPFREQVGNQRAKLVLPTDRGHEVFAIAQQLVGWLERAILSNLPGYSVVSTLGADIAGTGDAQSHMQVVLARIEDSWQLGLLVERIDETHSAVFVPGAPDPKSGSVYLMTDDRFKAVDVRIPQAMKCIKGLGVGSRELLAGRL